MTKKLTMMLAAAVAMAIGARAETEKVGDYTWTYRINGDTAEIYGTYDLYSYVLSISPSPTGAVTIPSTLGGEANDGRCLRASLARGRLASNFAVWGLSSKIRLVL